MTDTIRTESDLLNTFRDGQPAESITAQDMRDFIVSSKYLQSHGWQFFLDGAYPTEATPETFSAGVRKQLTIDGTASTLGHPVTTPAFWDVATNKITPNGLNNFGFVRIAMGAQSSGSGTNWFDIELDVSGLVSGTGSPRANGDIIYHETGVLIKGAGVPQYFNFAIPLFSGTNFQANGGTIYITPQADIEVWEKGITAVQVYGASPAI